jgi:hypothetical protein
MRATDGKFVEKPNWIERLFYREENRRGESSIDDCYQPGYFEIPVSPKREKEFGLITVANEGSREAKENLEAIGTAVDIE